MSGICGCISWDGAPVSESDLECMCRPVAYRGPDGIGTWLGAGAGLAHLALHITPESREEVQPLLDPESGLVLVADARIDNRDELIPVLRGKGGLRCDRPTDADLILAAYQTWGHDCPSHLIGDFAFAIWDTRERVLFLARDPMALRNLCFRAEPNRFLFATEPKQITAAPGVPRELYTPAVAAYLAGGHGSPEWTFQTGIQRFLTGHALTVQRGRMREWRYWNPDPEARIRYRSEDEYAEHLADLMKQAVRPRLRSIRPAGLLLSGGVDSGAVAATAGWLLANEPGNGITRPTAYSFAWDELAQCDERHISDPLAKYCGLPVSDVPSDDAWPLRPGSEELVEQDTPFLFGHYVLLERAAARTSDEGIGLIFGGDRGDLVWGMEIYDFPALLRAGRWKTLVRELNVLARWRGKPLTRLARQEAARVLRESARHHRKSWGSLPPFRRFTSVSPRTQWPDWLSVDMIERARQAHEDAWLESVPSFPDHAARERYRAIAMPLHMHGIEASERLHARHRQTYLDPWSDRRIIEFACQVPQRALTHVGEPKLLARRAVARLIPEHYVAAMRKIVPSPLFHRGLCGEGRAKALELMRASLVASNGFLDKHKLSAAYQAYCEGSPAPVAQIWRALTLELWLRAGFPAGERVAS